MSSSSSVDNPFYSYLKNQKDKNADTRSPFFCELLISEKCNLKCKTCYFWKYGLNDELTFDECKYFITCLKDIVKPPFEINLGGGEPLLQKRIVDLIKFCAEQGLQPAISTNATLINEEMAENISDSGLHRLSLSLKSLDENTHDFLVGVDGSYGRLMDAVRYLRKYWRAGDLNINAIILEQSIRDIINIVEWVNNDDLFTGIYFAALAQPYRTDLVDSWYLESEHSFLWPKDPKLACSIVDKLIKYKMSGYKILNPVSQLAAYKKYYENPGAFARKHRCNFGDYIFNVNVLGLVHLCCFMPPIGSIKKDNIRDIWYSEEARRTRSMMYNCKKSCNNIVNCYFQEEADEDN